MLMTRVCVSLTHTHTRTRVYICDKLIYLLNCQVWYGVGERECVCVRNAGGLAKLCGRMRRFAVAGQLVSGVCVCHTMRGTCAHTHTLTRSVMQTTD